MIAVFFFVLFVGSVWGALMAVVTYLLGSPTWMVPVSLISGMIVGTIAFIWGLQLSNRYGFQLFDPTLLWLRIKLIYKEHQVKQMLETATWEEKMWITFPFRSGQVQPPKRSLMRDLVQEVEQELERRRRSQ